MIYLTVNELTIFKHSQKSLLKSEDVLFLTKWLIGEIINRWIDDGNNSIDINSSILVNTGCG